MISEYERGNELMDDKKDKGVISKYTEPDEKVFEALEKRMYAKMDAMIKSRQDETYVCKYCGKVFRFGMMGGHNPSDFGLHYTDKDVYGKEYTCLACNNLVTVTNRIIKGVIDSGFSKESLDQLVKQAEWVRDNCEKWRD